jgi:hypothetical protein
MRRIVVYKITIIAGLILTGSLLNAQKHSIGLMPVSHQYRHPEAVIDTCFAIDSLGQSTPRVQSPVKQEKVAPLEPEATKVPLFVPIPRKAPGKISVNLMLFIREFNPLKLIINITALK